jgi:hypothetical protein
MALALLPLLDCQVFIGCLVANEVPAKIPPYNSILFTLRQRRESEAAHDATQDGGPISAPGA